MGISRFLLPIVLSTSPLFSQALVNTPFKVQEVMLEQDSKEVKITKEVKIYPFSNLGIPVKGGKATRLGDDLSKFVLVAIDGNKLQIYDSPLPFGGDKYSQPFRLVAEVDLKDRSGVELGKNAEILNLWSKDSWVFLIMDKGTSNSYLITISGDETSSSISLQKIILSQSIGTDAKLYGGQGSGVAISSKGGMIFFYKDKNLFSAEFELPEEALESGPLFLVSNGGLFVTKEHIIFLGIDANGRPFEWRMKTNFKTLAQEQGIVPTTENTEEVYSIVYDEKNNPYFCVSFSCLFNDELKFFDRGFVVSLNEKPEIYIALK